MSDQPEKYQKIFPPTPRRLKKAKDDGEVCNSKEVTSAGVILASGIGIVICGQEFFASLITGAQEAFSRSHEAAADPNAVIDVFTNYLTNVGVALLPLIILLILVIIMTSLMQSGLVLSSKALMPQFNRLNPIKKIKEMFGPTQALMRIATALMKLVFIGLVVGIIVAGEMENIELSTTRDVDVTASDLCAAVVRILLAAGMAFMIIASIDYSYQKYRFIQKLKMTHEEIKRERKEEEGSPELKAKRKSLYRELTLNRIVQEVPTADVVVTNPTHYAVALRYQQDKDGAPRVVAKATDVLALKIREIARHHGVPIVENRQLARALHSKVKVGRVVPMELFKAVAEVLAHVYQLRRRMRVVGGLR